MRTALPATAESFQLAEGPVWDTARERLLWVDILGGAVLEGTLDGNHIDVTGRHVFDGMVGAVAVSEDGTLLVAAQEHLVVIRPDGTRENGPRLIGSGQPRRLNDGSTDPAGRFLVGSLSLAEPSECEVLLRLEDDWSITQVDTDLTLSNGLAWSSDGGLMYSVDSLRNTVFIREYDPRTGVVGPRRTHLQLQDGVPDGIALDAEDHLWVAVWGAGEVRRFTPTGSLVDRVTVPAPHTSCVAFAGDDLQTLIITTATEGLSAEQRQAHPYSGRLFTTRLDVPGLPVPTWAGPTKPYSPMP